jgi:hypothetical protein
MPRHKVIRPHPVKEARREQRSGILTPDVEVTEYENGLVVKEYEMETDNPNNEQVWHIREEHHPNGKLYIHRTDAGYWRRGDVDVPKSQTRTPV